MDNMKQINLAEQIRRYTNEHNEYLNAREQNFIAEALDSFQKDVYQVRERIEKYSWKNQERRALDLRGGVLLQAELDIIRHALANYSTKKALEAMADHTTGKTPEAQAADILEAETLAGVIAKYTDKKEPEQLAELKAERELKALAVRDIEKESQQARDRFIERTKSMDSTQKYDAYSNCMMSTALLLVDRWGARFIPDICDALQLEQEELESTYKQRREGERIEFSQERTDRRPDARDPVAAE